MARNNGGSIMSAIEKIASLAGIFPIPRGIMEDTSAVVDPFIVTGTLASAAAIAAQPTDITANELRPYPAAAQGVLASKGTNEAYVGYIYGLSVYLGPVTAETPTALDDALRNTEICINSAGRQRSLPFKSALRVQPHLVTATADAEIQTCGAPGRPAYVFPVEPIPWTGISSCVLGPRATGVYVLVGSQPFAVEVWGVFAQGKPSEVSGDGCPVRDGNMLERLRALAQLKMAVLQGAPLPGGVLQRGM